MLRRALEFADGSGREERAERPGTSSALSSGGRRDSLRLARGSTRRNGTHVVKAGDGEEYVDGILRVGKGTEGKLLSCVHLQLWTEADPEIAGIL